MKTLIVIGTAEDDQARVWALLAEKWLRVVFLQPIDFKITWSLLADEKGVRVDDWNGGNQYASHDQEVYWYLRVPELNEPSLSQYILLLRQSLHRSDRLLPCSGLKPWASAKLLQTGLWRGKRPAAHVGYHSPARDTIGLITKGLSGASSRASLVTEGSRPCEFIPSFYQQRINGAHSKVHCWINKEGLHHLYVATDSQYVDPRDDPDLRYQRCRLPDDVRLKLEQLGSKIGCRFFDVDFIDKDGDLFFLEVNFSPAPVWFESRFDTPDYTFSEQALSDWLLSYA